VSCQLETLRYCLLPSVRRTLDELPESLDETYERVLKEIKKANRDHYFIASLWLFGHFLRRRGMKNE
jgi:hypothetical protein